LEAIVDTGADDVLLPLERRLRDWTEWDEAAFFLGKLLGVLPESFSFGNAKGILYGSRPGEPGRKLILLLNLLADIGVLEMRNSYREFRWASKTAAVPDDQAGG
jgi:hypothetical protein